MFLTRILDSHKRPLGVFFKDGDGDDGQGGGGGGQDWRDGLPEELRANPSIADTPDVSTLAQRYIDTKSMVGRSLRLPGENAGEEDWDNFHKDLMAKVPTLMFKPDTSDSSALQKVYDQLGRPESAEKYSVPEIDDKGTKINTALIEKFREIAYANGLSQTQFNGVVSQLTSASIEEALERQAAMDDDVKSLITEWGAAYEKNLQIARAVAERLKAPDFILGPLKSGTPPSQSAKFFFDLAAAIGQEGTEIIDNHGQSEVMTPDEAKLQMDEMRRNGEHPLNNPSSPGHHAALARYQELAHYAYPKRKVA